MAQLLLFVIGVLLLCVTALAALWVAGQALVGLGALLTGAAGVLLQLLWFTALALTGGGVSYFVAHAWRPGKPVTTLTSVPPVSVPPANAPEAPFWRREGKTQTVIAAQPSVTVSPPTPQAPAPPGEPPAPDPR